MHTNHTFKPRFLQREEVHERQIAFLKGIEQWVNNRTAKERLAREEIAALDGLGRLQAQRRSLLDNLAHFYARHPNADTAPGVLALITFYSDNNAGCCSLSVKRMARFLSRSERRISDALTRLADQNMIAIEPVPGRPSRLIPWVHKTFAATNDPLTWLLDARAPLESLIAQTTPDGSVTRGAGILPPLTPVSDTPDTGDTPPPTAASGNTTSLDTTNKTTIRESEINLRPSASNGLQLFDAEKAIELYNEQARLHGWTIATLTSARRKLLQTRIAEIGGYDNYVLAVHHVRHDAFLMGKMPPKAGGKRFRLELEFLLSTATRMGDVLARLLDAANEKKIENLRKEEIEQKNAEIAKRFRRMAEEEGCDFRRGDE